MKSLVLVFLIIPNLIISDSPTLNVTLTQIENWIVELKITQVCSVSCKTLRGTLVIPYKFNKNSIDMKKQIRINSISIYDNSSIIRNVSIPVYDTELTMENKGNVGNTEVEINPFSITVEMPKITNVQAESINGPIKVILTCGNCNSYIVIPEGTEVPDDSFKIEDTKGENYTFLRSCTSIQKKITSNTPFNITCIPFSPGTIQYNTIFSVIDKIGFIHVGKNLSNNIAYKSNYKDCESLLHGNPIYYDINSEINPTFTLTSPYKIEDTKDLPFLFANDTYIQRKENIELCDINPSNKYEIICGVDFIHFPHFKQDENDSSVYFIYEEKTCGKAFTGVIVISSNQSFIKAGIFSIFLILLF